MRILFIKPNIGRIGEKPYLDKGRMEPLQIGVLAALTPSWVDVLFADDRCEEIPYDEKFDLVAITVETFTAKRSYEISAEFQKRKVPVIMGGFHPTLLPDEALEHADSIFLHDGESAWHNVIKDLKENKKLKRIYKSKCGHVQNGGLLPRRDLFKNKGYLPVRLTQFGRGCINNCTFCAVSRFFSSNHYYRPVDDVINEIREQLGRYIFFVDDNIVADKERSKELFRAMIPLKRRWVSQGCLDMLDDPELMDLIVKSGCLGNVIGFESINPADLKSMKKNFNLGEAQFDGYKGAVEKLRSYGLQSWAAFTLGHDWDNEESIEATFNFALTNKFTFAAYNIICPYPNTPLYDKLKEEGRLLYDGKWWLHPDYRFNYASYKPKLISADKLTEAVFSVRKRWNSTSSIIKRFLEPRTNMRTFERALIYWSYNPLFQRETFKKHGMYFGYKR